MIASAPALQMVTSHKVNSASSPNRASRVDSAPFSATHFAYDTYSTTRTRPISRAHIRRRTSVSDLGVQRSLLPTHHLQARAIKTISVPILCELIREHNTAGKDVALVTCINYYLL